MAQANAAIDPRLQSHYFPNLERAQATDMLKAQPIISFIIRVGNNASAEQPFTISYLKKDMTIVHHRIYYSQQRGGYFAQGSEDAFSSIFQLLLVKGFITSDGRALLATSASINAQPSTSPSDSSRAVPRRSTPNANGVNSYGAINTSGNRANDTINTYGRLSTNSNNTINSYGAVDTINTYGSVASSATGADGVNTYGAVATSRPSYNVGSQQVSTYGSAADNLVNSYGNLSIADDAHQRDIASKSAYYPNSGSPQPELPRHSAPGYGSVPLQSSGGRGRGGDGEFGVWKAASGTSSVPVNGSQVNTYGNAAQAAGNSNQLSGSGNQPAGYGSIPSGGSVFSAKSKNKSPEVVHDYGRVPQQQSAASSNVVHGYNMLPHGNIRSTTTNAGVNTYGNIS